MDLLPFLNSGNGIRRLGFPELVRQLNSVDF